MLRRVRAVFPGWWPVAAAALCGALMALGQAPLGWWFVTLPALAVLVALVARNGAGRAAWLGWFGGAGYFAVAMSWIVQPFLVDVARYGWMAPFAVILMAFGMALFWAVGAGFGVWVGGVSARVGLVLGLGLAELARSYVLTGFPWALIGHVWIDTPVAQVAAWGGPVGLSLVTLAAAALLTWGGWRGGAAALTMVAALWVAGAERLAQPLPNGPGAVVRLVQPNAAQDAKWNPDHAAEFFDRLMRATAAPAGPLGAVDLVIWPETALPYLVVDYPALPGLIASAGQGAAVLVGQDRYAEGQVWNNLQIYGPGGAVMASYDKHHLVPFGEYLPLGDIAYDWFGFTAFASRAGTAFVAGPGPQVLDLGGRLGLVVPLICYEAVFPQDLRTATRPGWIVQITNDAWFGTLSGPYQHAAQARLRAIEQGLPLIRVANTGVSEVIDARGQVVAALPFGTEGHLDAALPGALPATPYASWGDWPILALLLAGLSVLAMYRKVAPSA